MKRRDRPMRAEHFLNDFVIPAEAGIQERFGGDTGRMRVNDT